MPLSLPTAVNNGEEIPHPGLQQLPDLVVGLWQAQEGRMIARYLIHWSRGHQGGCACATAEDADTLCCDNRFFDAYNLEDPVLTAAVESPEFRAAAERVWASFSVSANKCLKQWGILGQYLALWQQRASTSDDVENVHEHGECWTPFDSLQHGPNGHPEGIPRDSKAVTFYNCNNIVMAKINVEGSWDLLNAAPGDFGDGFIFWVNFILIEVAHHPAQMRPLARLSHPLCLPSRALIGWPRQGLPGVAL